MPYDPSKHHRRSIRLRGYDYSQVGAYFVTICEKNRECLFGEVIDAGMHRNQFGEILLKWWNELPKYYPPVELDEFVVMPNHIHGIIVITDSVGAALRRLPASSPLPNKRTLGQLMGYYKHQSTKEINQLRDSAYAKLLQRDYYEHIIRNQREWEAIAQYIRNNPANWCADLDNPSYHARHSPLKSSDDYWRDVGL